MKRCPQCNSLFEDSVQFCLNDGMPLVEEKFAMPSDEEETIIRHDPITINIPSTSENVLTHQPAPTAENIVVVPASSYRNSALFLIAGLIIGGGLVLATLLLAKNYFQSPNTNSAQTANTNRPVNVTVSKPTSEIANANVSANTTANTNVIASETPSAKHAEPNDDANDGLFNGRVITTNARVRRDPSLTAPVVDVLPFGDRLDIIDRAAPNSPWYQIECEHGTSGWMHGDTIEFTKGNF